MNQTEKVAVLVAGMHRSGTSAITRILGILGCDLPRNLVAPHPSNERGFWESQDIVALDRDILVSAGTKLEDWRADEWRAFDPRWYDSPQVERFHDRAQAVLENQFGDSRLFVIKDPRICRLLPFWLDTLDRFGARVLIVSPIRNPLDVADSLESRDGIRRPISCLMWLQHVLSAEAATRSLRRAFLRYERLLVEPHAIVDRLEQALGLAWPRRMSDADEEIDAFLSSGLRHHRNADDHVIGNPRIPAWLRSTFEILDRWTRGEVHESDTAELDRVKKALDGAMPAFDRAVAVGLITTRELSTTREERDQGKKQVGELTEALADRDGYIEKLTGNLAERDAHVVERDAYIEKLTGNLAERDAQVAERDAYIEKLAGKLVERDAQVAERDAQVAERDAQVAEQGAQVAERDARLSTLTGVLSQRDAQIVEREREIGALTGARDEHDRYMNEILADRDRRLEELNRTLAVMLDSKSWRLTRPLRGVVRLLTGSRDSRWPSLGPGRGPLSLLRKFRFHAQTYGLRSALRHTRFFIAARLPGTRRRRARRAAAASDTTAPAQPVPDIPAPGTLPPPAAAPLPATAAAPAGSPATAAAPSAAVAPPAATEAAPAPEEPCPAVAMLVQSLHDGGLEKVVIDLAGQFRQQGIVTPVLVLGGGGRAAAEATALGCDVRTFDGDVPALVAAAQSLQVRAVLTHHCYEPLERLAQAGIEIIEVIHNVYHWQRDKPYFADLRADCIGRFVAVSDFVADYARDALRVPADRLHVIENGLSRHGLIRPPLSRLSQRRRETIDRPVLAHLANAHPQKNHIALLRAFGRFLQVCPNATLVLAGVIDASTEVGRRVQAELDSLGLDGRVRCTGPLDRRAVSHLLARAHIGLLPSGFEGFSIGSLEYAYFGLPTVLSDTGAARRLADRYGHVVVAEGAACPPGELTPARIERGGIDPDPAAVDGIAKALGALLAEYDRFAGRAERAGLDWEAYAVEATARRYRELLVEAVAP